MESFSLVKCANRLHLDVKVVTDSDPTEINFNEGNYLTPTLTAGEPGADP